MTDEMGGCECLYYGSSMYAIVSPLLCVLGSSEKKMKIAGYHQPHHTSCTSLIRPSIQGEYYSNLVGRSAIRVD